LNEKGGSEKDPPFSFSHLIAFQQYLSSEALGLAYLQKDRKCLSEQSEESFVVPIVLVLLKISPAGRNNNHVDSRIFAGKRARETPTGSSIKQNPTTYSRLYHECHLIPALVVQGKPPRFRGSLSAT
jgi:hypothetical protein